MRKITRMPSLTVGIFLGLIFSQVNSSHADPLSKTQIRNLLGFSNIAFKPRNYHCEEGAYKTVGDVLAQIFHAGISDRREVHFKCYDIEKSSLKKCSVSYSTCTEWKKAECGSLLLVFPMNPKTQKIDSNSFECLQVP